MDIKQIGIEEIKPYANNTKKHDKKQIEQVANSISRFGWSQPLVVDNNNNLIIGHCRLLAGQKLGLESVPVVVMDNLTSEEVNALRLADNKLNESEWDVELVNSELKGLSYDLIDLTGFSRDLIIENNEKDDNCPDIPKEPKSKVGDLYILGNHRLLCGNSTKIEDVSVLMDNKKADLAFNDPPYGMKKEKDGVKNDNLNYDDLLEFNKKWILLQFEYLKENGSWYCWGIDEPLMDIYSGILKPLIKQQKATFRNLITWDKGCGQGQNSEHTRSYATADEKCLFVMCGVQGFNNNSDNYFEGWEPIRDYLLKSRLEMGWDVPEMKRIAGHSDLNRDHWTGKSQFSLPTEKVYNKLKKEAERLNKNAFKKEYDELKKEYDELKDEYYSTRAYFNNTHDNFNNVWSFKRDLTNLKHTTPKPIELCDRIIKSSSREGEIVLDFFGGSGSTLIACEKTKRKCYTIELEPKYCDVIIQRYCEYVNNFNIIKNGENILWEKN